MSVNNDPYNALFAPIADQLKKPTHTEKVAKTAEAVTENLSKIIESIPSPKPLDNPQCASAVNHQSAPMFEMPLPKNRHSTTVLGKVFELISILKTLEKAQGEHTGILQHTYLSIYHEFQSKYPEIIPKNLDYNDIPKVIESIRSQLTSDIKIHERDVLKELCKQLEDNNTNPKVLEQIECFRDFLPKLSIYRTGKLSEANQTLVRDSVNDRLTDLETSRKNNINKIAHNGSKLKLKRIQDTRRAVSATAKRIVMLGILTSKSHHSHVQRKSKELLHGVFSTALNNVDKTKKAQQKKLRDSWSNQVKSNAKAQNTEAINKGRALRNKWNIPTTVKPVDGQERRKARDITCTNKLAPVGGAGGPVRISAQHAIPLIKETIQHNIKSAPNQKVAFAIFTKILNGQVLSKFGNMELLVREAPYIQGAAISELNEAIKDASDVTSMMKKASVFAQGLNAKHLMMRHAFKIVVKKPASE